MGGDAENLSLPGANAGNTYCAGARVYFSRNAMPCWIVGLDCSGTCVGMCWECGQ
jgi:hypothetical protein